MFFRNISFLLLLVVHGSLQKTSPSRPTYRAAVVEFHPVLYEDDAARTLNENAAKMENFIKQAAKENTDIVVFPELVPTTVCPTPRDVLFPWTTEVPAPSRHYAPCDSNDNSISDDFRQLSCAAKRHKIYVAINLTERKNCMGIDCPLDGLYYYVTTAVFDREGVVVSRYRKSHLVDEHGVLDLVNPPEMLTFITDFGVTFSIIICFDILFQKPWINVARELNVTDFIFQTAWDIKLPFLSPIQVQSSWSYIEDVNLLASGYNLAEKGYTGSGIYAGRQGILTASIIPEKHEKLLIADVPKKIKKGIDPSITHCDPGDLVKLSNENLGYGIREASFPKHDGYFHVVNDSLHGLKTIVIARNGYVVQELSHNGVKCKFEVNVTNLGPRATYRLIAYDGLYAFENGISITAKICSVIECMNDTLDSCGRIHDSSTIFQSIAVTAIHVDHVNTTMAPNSVGTNLFPLEHWLFDQYKQGENIHTFMILPKPTQNVITFGIWGRNYDDSTASGSIEESTFNSISSAYGELLALLIVVVCLGKLFFIF